MKRVLTENQHHYRSPSNLGRRANRTEDQLPSREGMGRMHNVGERYFWSGAGPMYRWLQSWKGRLWNEVFSDAAKSLDCKTFIGREFRSRLLENVELNTFMKDGEVWCNGGVGASRSKEMPVNDQTYRKFYVHPETGLLSKVPDKPKPLAHHKVNEQRFAPVRRWEIEDHLLLLKLRGLWFECRMKAYSPYWQFVPRDVVFNAMLIGSHAREAYGQAVYCVGKRQLSRKRLRELELINSGESEDCFLRLMGTEWLEKIRRTNSSPCRLPGRTPVLSRSRHGFEHCRYEKFSALVSAAVFRQKPAKHVQTHPTAYHHRLARCCRVVVRLLDRENFLHETKVLRLLSGF